MGATIEAPLDAATCITVEDFFTLDATQHLFVGALHATAPDEVPAHNAAVALQVGDARFGEVAQEVRCAVVVVLAHSAGAHREARELIQLLLEATHLFGLELREEDLRRVGIVAPIDVAVTHGGELLHDLFTWQTQCGG